MYLCICTDVTLLNTNFNIVPLVRYKSVYPSGLFLRINMAELIKKRQLNNDPVLTEERKEVDVKKEHTRATRSRHTKSGMSYLASGGSVSYLKSKNEYINEKDELGQVRETTFDVKAFLHNRVTKHYQCKSEVEMGDA